MSDLNNYPWIKQTFNNLNISSLPHSSLLEGNKGLGKAILVNEIAKTILCLESNNNPCNQCDSCELYKNETHPDFIKNNDETKILIDEIREIIDFSYLSSSISLSKVIFLHNCENMNRNSQNALLKTLEEPTDNTYILMTSSKKRALNPNIYSICNKIKIDNLDQKQINEWIVEQGFNDFNYYDFPSFLNPLEIVQYIDEGDDKKFIKFSETLLQFCNKQISINETTKFLIDLDMPLIDKINLLVDFYKNLLSSRISKMPYSGKFIKLNDLNFSTINLSNVINELNDLREMIYKVSSLNESHLFKYFIFKLNSIIKLQ
jgi:DNA polymerase-3 subunit delta'